MAVVALDVDAVQPQEQKQPKAPEERKSDDAKAAKAAVAPRSARDKLAALKPSDFELTDLQTLGASEPNYRHGAYCDRSSVRLGHSAHAQFWHSAEHGVDLSQPAFEKHFRAEAARAAAPATAVA